jgi:benzoyl-CoA reductase subunit C
VQDILRRFQAIAQNPGQYLAQWKESTQKKIIACLPMHFPEEIVHAAGLLPVIIWESPEPFSIAYAHIPSFFCGFVRSVVDMALRDKINFFDGIVFPDTCLQVRGIKNILYWNYKCTFQGYLFLPPVLRGQASSMLLRDELIRFRAGLENLVGHEITDQALAQSIDLYNRNRKLLRELYDLRREDPRLLTAKEILAIVSASMVMPKEEHSQLLSDLLSKLRTVPPATRNGLRLILAGSLCEAPKFDILDILEEAGAVVVDDDLYTGSRYFVQDVEVNVSPMEAVARHYETMIPCCPSRIDPKNDWGSYLVNMVRRNNAQGVVNLMVKYCEPHNLWYPDVKKSLEKAGIPEFLLETDHEIMSLWQIKTRLQAFVEMIGGVSSG